MIKSHSTKYNAGIKIIGDYYDFMNLRETVHYIASENGAISAIHSEWLLSLAYELRHAAQKDREIISYGQENDSLTYFAFDVLWPQFLVQVGMLRASAAFVPTNSDHQANIYRLEHCIESSLLEADPKVARDVMLWMRNFNLPGNDFLIDFVSHQSLIYATTEKTAKRRISNLRDILYTFNFMSPIYAEYKKELEAIAKDKKCRPEDLRDFTEWPGFKW